MKFLKVLLLLLIVVAFFALGYLRQEFHDWLSIWHQKANAISYKKYPLTFTGMWRGIMMHSSWTLNICFTLAYANLSAVLAWILFSDKRYTLFVFLGYLFLLLLTGIFILVSIMTDQYQAGYGFAQKMKFFMQSPLPVMLLMAIFWKKIKL